MGSGTHQRKVETAFLCSVNRALDVHAPQLVFPSTSANDIIPDGIDAVDQDTQLVGCPAGATSQSDEKAVDMAALTSDKSVGQRPLGDINESTIDNVARSVEGGGMEFRDAVRNRLLLGFCERNGVLELVQRHVEQRCGDGRNLFEENR